MKTRMIEEHAKLIRSICEQLSGVDEGWESISYAAFYEDKEQVAVATQRQITTFETTLRRLRELQAALGSASALQAILDAMYEEDE